MESEADREVDTFRMSGIDIILYGSQYGECPRHALVDQLRKGYASSPLHIGICQVCTIRVGGEGYRYLRPTILSYPRGVGP